MTTVRTIFLDYDARNRPKTDRHCILCQRDIRAGRPSAWVHVIEGGSHVLHPADELLYVPDRGDMGFFEIGPDCARKLGLEWTWRDMPQFPL